MTINTDAIFDRLSPALIGREGKYVDHPSDKGGETNWGITIAVARADGYRGAMRDLPRARALAIYRAEYWDRPGFAAVATVSVPVAEELFDTGVNMGQPVAAIFLQRALNALNRQGVDYPDIPVDGKIGAGTIAALRRYFAVRGQRAERVLLRVLNSLQGERYVDLSEKRAKNEDFTFGWFDVRVAI